MTLLTFMSILEAIEGYIPEELQLLEPLIPGTPVLRKIYVNKKIVNLFTGPWSDELPQSRCLRLWADLDLFTSGGRIAVCMEPFKAKSAYMGLLDPVSNGMFDIRSRDPSPGLRVFGGFAATDTFVALTYDIRKDMGDRDSAEWRKARVECLALWRNLFPAYKPLTGENVHDFISTNVIRV